MLGKTNHPMWRNLQSAQVKQTTVVYFVWSVQKQCLSICNMQILKYIAFISSLHDVMSGSVSMQGLQEMLAPDDGVPKPCNPLNFMDSVIVIHTTLRSSAPIPKCFKRTTAFQFSSQIRYRQIGAWHRTYSTLLFMQFNIMQPSVWYAKKINKKKGVIFSK